MKKSLKNTRGKWLRTIFKPFTLVLLFVALFTALPPLLFGIPPHVWYIAQDIVVVALVGIVGGLLLVWTLVYYIGLKYPR